MPTVPEIICAMREVAPAGQQQLGDRELAELRRLTQELVAAKPHARYEYERYVGLRDRGIAQPEAELDAWLGGASVLVTGGTGCIGAALMAQLAARRPARLVSVSRGRTDGWPRQDRADYLHADIRNERELGLVFDEVRPDVVFNVAAQRDPGLAERQVYRTVSTALPGLRNVLRAAEKSGVKHLIHASTGKALRPYSGEVYAASKRAAEWVLVKEAERSSICLSAARFTHVVDNSIVYQRLLNWCDGGVIRLHESDILFYGQSALESAQLLLCAGLAGRRGTLRLAALNDLGWPVNLLDLAVGLLASTGSESPIYFSGHGPGYESTPFPALYDPLTAGEVSPLLNVFEAAGADQACSGAVDVCPLELASDAADEANLASLEQLLVPGTDPELIRAALDKLSWSLLDATYRAVPPALLRRAAGLAARYEDELSPVYLRMLAAMRRHAEAGRLIPA